MKNLLENKEMVFKNGVKNIQTAGYNGSCTVVIFTMFNFNLIAFPRILIC